MLWSMRDRLLGLGGLQVTLTAAAVTGIAMLLGQPWSIALAVGLLVALPALAGVVAAWNGPGDTWAQSRSPVMMFGVEISGAPYGGTVFEPGAAASVAIVVGLAGWVLARTQTLNAERLEAAYAVLRRNGYDTSRIMLIEQGG